MNIGKNPTSKLMFDKIKYHLQDEILKARDIEINALKLELRQLREQQILAYSDNVFRAYAMYLWRRQGTGSIKFENNRCRIVHWDMVNHGLEFEIHEKIIIRAYAYGNPSCSDRGENEFFKDNKIITGCAGYTDRWKDPALKENGYKSFFFRLIEPVE